MNAEKILVTKENQFVKVWVPVAGFVLLVAVYVWSSGRELQEIESRSLENSRDIEYMRNTINDKFNRIDDKLDLINSKLN